MRRGVAGLLALLLACRSSPTERPDAVAQARQDVSVASAAPEWDWNAIYRDGGDFNHAPSKFLVAMTADRKPGTALDVSMGQGRNSLFLASRGWHVTGIDTSDEGLRQAREAAAAQRLAIDAIQADEETWDYGANRWDLVVLVYAGRSTKIVDSVRKGLRPGGLVVVECFHRDTAPAIGSTPAELSALFGDGFTTLRNEVVVEESDWGCRCGVPEKVVRFAAARL